MLVLIGITLLGSVLLQRCGFIVRNLWELISGDITLEDGLWAVDYTAPTLFFYMLVVGVGFLVAPTLGIFTLMLVGFILAVTIVWNVSYKPIA